jgi:hypothetical protein
VALTPVIYGDCMARERSAGNVLPGWPLAEHEMRTADPCTEMQITRPVFQSTGTRVARMKPSEHLPQLGVYKLAVATYSNASHVASSCVSGVAASDLGEVNNIEKRY